MTLDPEQIKWHILNFLARTRKEKGPYELGSLRDLADELGISHKQLVGIHALELQNLGLIQIETAGDESLITNQGMALLNKESPFYAAYRQEVKHISIRGPISQSAIAIDGSTATFNVTLRFLDRAKSTVSDSRDLTEAEKSTWLTRIKELSNHPVLLKILEKVLTASL